jgi:hypothetical protein
MVKIPEQRFRLRESTVAIGRDEASQQVFVNIPIGAEITVVDDDVPHAPFATVNWIGRKLELFAVDLESRGERVCAVTEA